MKLYLDECLGHELHPLLVGHDAFSARYMRWTGVGNGELIRRVVAGGFDAMLTIDKNMPFQHNVRTIPIPNIVLDAASNALPDLLPLVPALLELLDRRPPPGFHVVPRP